MAMKTFQSPEDVIKNIIEVVHLADATQKAAAYNEEKLNLDILRKQQQCDQFYKNKVKEMEDQAKP